MAGSLTSDMHNQLKFCANCLVYDWKQPSLDLLKRCTGCRVPWYCDEMCQKEHWDNTHKTQCKYLSKKKVLSSAKHEETTCLVCKEEARVGKEEMTKQNNPILPCTMSRANKELMNIGESFCEVLPYVALGEMTGVYHTKLECLIVTCMRILVKMKMTRHSLWQGSRTAVLAGNLYMRLWMGRIRHLSHALSLKKPGPLEGQLALQSFGSGSSNKETNGLFETVAAIEKIRNAAELRGIIASEEMPSLLKPWGTIKVLTGLILAGDTCLSMYAADCLEVGGVPDEIARVRITSAQFNKMRDSVVSLLSGGLVQFTRLVVDGLCGGNPVQQCIVCREEVNVTKVAVVSISPYIPGDPVFVLKQKITYSLCNRKACFDISEDSYDAVGYELNNMYLKLYGEHVKELCDYCGKMNDKAKGLRCGRCKTKLYCGVECQVKDIYHLQKIECKKGGKRKKKRTDSSRKEDGVKEIKGNIEVVSFKN